MNTYGLWGSQSGWAKSFSAAYSNFSNSSDGPKGYNYATRISVIFMQVRKMREILFFIAEPIITFQVTVIFSILKQYRKGISCSNRREIFAEW